MEKKVSFSKEVIVEDLDFNDFLTAAEADIIHDCEQINESVDLSIKTTQKKINRNIKAIKKSTNEKDIDEYKQGIETFKSNISLYEQIKIKMDKTKTLYIDFQNLYKRRGKTNEYEKVIKGPPMTQEEQDIINEMYEFQHEEKPQDLELIHAQEALEAEIYHEHFMKDITDYDFVPNSLSMLEKFFVLQLTKSIISKRTQHEKEEFLIIQILNNIAKAKYFYNSLE